MSSVDELSHCPRHKKDIHSGVGLTQMTKLKQAIIVDNPHIVNAKKGSKMTPICGLNRGETLPRQQFGSKYKINTVKENLLEVGKASARPENIQVL